MVLAPAVPRARRGGHERLNARGRFAAAAVAPLVYNLAIIVGAILLVPVVRDRRPRRRRRARRARPRARPAAVARPDRRAVLPPSLELGGPRRRARRCCSWRPRALGLGATQIVFIVMTGLASTLGEGADRRSSTSRSRCSRSRSGSSACRWAWCSCRRCRARRRRARRTTFRRLLVRGLAMLGLVMIADRRAGHRASRRTWSALLFDYGTIGDERDRADGADPRRVPRRADRPLADRRPRPGLLRAPGHGDAGRGRARAPSSSTSSLANVARRAATARGPRRRDRDRGVAGAARRSWCCCARRVPGTSGSATSRS